MIQTDKARIFLCHASEDKEPVREIYHQLKSAGYNPWMDKEDLLPGQRWEREIPRALRAARFVIPFFSHAAVGKRGYIQKEFNLALDVLGEIPEDQIYIIPVRLDDCDVPERFKEFQYCDLFETNGFEKVLKAIQSGITYFEKKDQPPSLKPQKSSLKEKPAPVKKPVSGIKRILILAANPKNTSKLRLDEEVREIDEGLRRSRLRDHFEIKQKLAVRRRDLRRALLDFEPHIVHFCGHGATDGIILENEQGQAVPVKPEALAALFALFDDQIECVLLNACYSEAQAKAIRRHIKDVVGMQKAIGDRAAIEFAVGFYDALGAGKSYKKAFQFGRSAIQLYNIPEHQTPVLQPRETPPQKQPPKTLLRATPVKNLSESDVKAMLQKYDFYCGEYDWSKGWANPAGKGIAHEYETKTIRGDKVVIDHHTGLTWQQSGSVDDINYKNTQAYIDELNKKAFAGYRDWRLPTLEEAMSLMEREEKNGDLYIDPVFDDKQRWIWTADTDSASRAWGVSFYGGGCGHGAVNLTIYVRAVR